MSIDLPRPIPSIDVIEALPRRAADERISYGAGEFQFGDLWLPPPDTPQPFATAVFLHGGCWLARRSLDYAASFCTALSSHGLAVWCPEYRRIDNDGGGFPGTFADVADAIDFAATIGQRHPLDLSRLVLLGHSAGGHLALWSAGRHRVHPASPLARPAGVAAAGVVSMAGIADLETYIDVGNDCSRSVEPLMGGRPAEFADRYHAGNPTRLLPTGISTRLIHGEGDAIVPLEQPQGYMRAAVAAGDDCQIKVLPIDGHFEVVAPGSAAFAAVLSAIGEIISPRR